MPSFLQRLAIYGRAVSFCAFAVAPTLAAQRLAPPVAPVHPVTDTYWGHDVVDPYRWLEDQTSPESKTWMRGQADFTRSTLDSMPGRKTLQAEITRYVNASDVTIVDVRLAGDFLFYRKRTRAQTSADLYVRRVSGGAERLLVDVNRLGTKEHHVSLDDYIPSLDGKLVAVSLSAGGSEEKTAHLFQTTDGRELPEQFPRYDDGRFSPDGRQFFYMQLEDLGPNGVASDKYRRPREYAHTLGSPVSADKVVLGMGVSPEVTVPDYSYPVTFPTPNSNYVLALLTSGTDVIREVYVAASSALSSHTGYKKVAGLADKVTDAVVEGDDLFLVSFQGAPNGQLLKTSAIHPDLKTAEVVIPASELVFSGGFIGEDVLHQASDALYLNVIDKGYGEVLRLPYTAGARASLIPLPAGMQSSGIATSPATPGALLNLQSYTDPGDFYRYTAEGTGLAKLGLRVPNAIDPTNLVAEEVEAKSWDGTLVPITILYKRGLARNGANPTYLTGYGAFGDATLPNYSRLMNAWLERGGVYAIAHVRGGGELGDSWYLGGKKLTKPNTWRDFIACAQYLIAHGYTSSGQLGIESGSTGGILIGRSITERPDLFAAAVDRVPCSDMLRFETGPGGAPNYTEFGSVKTQEGFEDLYAMSSYHHIQDGSKYPAVLVTAGANDPRVDPWQGGKMAARLQAATSSGKPVLLRVNYDAGHGFTDTTSQRVSDMTDTLSFLLWNFGDPGFQPAH